MSKFFVEIQDRSHQFRIKPEKLIENFIPNKILLRYVFSVIFTLSMFKFKSIAL